MNPRRKTESSLHGLTAVLENGEDLIKRCCEHLGCDGCSVPPPPVPLPGATRIRWCDAELESSSSDEDEPNNGKEEAADTGNNVIDEINNTGNDGVVTFNFGAVSCAPAETNFGGLFTDKVPNPFSMKKEPGDPQTPYSAPLWFERDKGAPSGWRGKRLKPFWWKSQKGTPENPLGFQGLSITR